MRQDPRSTLDPTGSHTLPEPPESTPSHQLPWPSETDPAHLTGRREDRNELAREFAAPHYAEDRQLARSFEDPNAADDARLGRAFEDANFSGKKRKPPVAEHVSKPRNWRPVFIIVAIVLVLAVIGALIGFIPRHNRDKQINERAQTMRGARPTVEVEQVTQVKDQQGLVLPGTTIPLTEAYIYARANGYLKKRLVDIGDHVRKGQLLAVIDAPDLDAQVAQAREQLRQAEQQLEQQRSQLALATVTVNRYRVLVAKGVFSRQDGDIQETNYTANLANVAAAQRQVDAFRANLQRNLALQSYEQVRAPFAGVITQRNVDLGALIGSGGNTGGPIGGPAPQGQTSATGGSQQAGQTNTAGTSGNISASATTTQSPGQGGALFGVAAQQRLRLLVSVPEGYVNALKPGGHAQVSFVEYPGHPFVGDVTRTADSVDPNTRTMLTEVQLDNRSGELKSGMYAVVTFPPARSGGGGSLMINGDAIVIRNDQSTVAVVTNGKIHFQPVVAGRDFGSAVEIASGLQAGDLVVTQVTDDVVEGAPVDVHASAPAGQQSAQPPSQNTPPGGGTRYGNQGITDANLQGKQGEQNQHGQQHGKSSGNGSKSATSESRP